MRVQPIVEVSPDPKYCGKCIVTDICDYLVHGNCVLYIDHSMKRKTETFAVKRFTRLEFDRSNDYMYLKCDECKEECKKREEQMKKIKSGGVLNKEEVAELMKEF